MKALITGASSGIGAAFARKLAEEGHDLVLVARRKDRLEALAAEVSLRHAISAEALVADLSDPAGIERVETKIGELDTLDLLINNAGFGTSGDFVDADLEKQLAMIQVHDVASVRLCRAALPGMISRGIGFIINVSSTGAFTPAPEIAIYSATKMFLITFSEALQMELEGTGVRVQALCPGFTHTGFQESPEFEHADRSWVPEALWMSPEEVAQESLAALGRRKVVYVPGLKNRLLAMAGRMGLTSLLLRAVSRRGLAKASQRVRTRGGER